MLGYNQQINQGQVEHDKISRTDVDNVAKRASGD